jgi:predicted metal-dependent HD superfamily phosphohydrolase
METVEHLIRRFAALWRRVGCADDGRKVFDALWSAWGEPHRHYHGREHLLDCLQQLDGSPPTDADRDLAELALWFHDAVYVPQGADNEACSAEWSARALRECGAPAAQAERVAALIRETDHARPSQDPTGALVCDVDLSILGRPAPEFAEYERRIRAEYRRVPDLVYRVGRAAILRGLLSRGQLFQTDYFRALYEDRARENVTASLAALSD